jgi:ligand-binding sensor domain-containing protein/serine phosphatase RsbU (regulator of sigma subunit)
LLSCYYSDLFVKVVCMLKYLLVMFLSVVFVTVSGQKMDLKFEGFTIQDGLSSNTVNDIIRDCDGFMWFATEDGINRYDGINFKAYKSIESDSTTICSNIVFSLLNNSCDKLLVGSSGGLNIYNPVFDQFDRVLEGVEVWDIIEYSHGGYMLATSDGLIQLNDDFEVFKRYNTSDENTTGLLTNDLTCVLEDSQGRLWVGDFQNGIHLMTSDGVFKNYSRGNNNSKGDFCTELTEDHKNRVLVATYDAGLLCFNDGLDEFIKLPIRNHNEIYDKTLTVYEDERNRLWVGTDGAGLVFYDTINERYETYSHSLVSTRSITDNVVTVVFSDKRGGVWLGSHHRGVNFINEFSASFKHKEYIPSFENNNVVSAFKRDEKGNLWLATDGGGLVYYDIQKGRTNIYESNEFDSTSLSSNNTLALELDASGALWVGSYNGGVDVFDSITQRFKHYRHVLSDSNSLGSDIVWSIYKDLNGRMWVATRYGLCLYQPETDDFIQFTTKNTNLVHDNVRHVLEIDSSHFYVATEGGLSIFDLENRSFQNFSHDVNDPKSISSSFVLNVTKDFRGRIWVGTYGGGINLFDPITETFKSWKEEDGLTNNYICGVVPGLDGNLWITTQRGLSKYNPRRDEFHNFYYHDGLQDDKFSIGAVLRWSDDKILIGGINGYNSFLPQHINTNSFPPPLHFTDFKIFNESIDFTSDAAVMTKHISMVDEIELAYHQNMVSFHFAALNFIQSEKNQVSFYLEGFDKKWSEAENIDKASYTNLSPGRYVFHVRAANNHGVWNDKELSVRVIVYPPYWETWWFLSFLSVIVAVSLLGVYRYRLKSITTQKENLELEVAQRTEVIHSKNEELEYRDLRRKQSLNYAKLIQNAVLPSVKEIRGEVKELFVLYQPSEIVSGDFYWMKKVEGKTIICAVDCTGHGVPGAFMSMMGNVLLNRIVKGEKTISPAEILEKLHRGVVRSLHQKENHNADGMDMSVVVIDNERKVMTYAGAMNPLVYFQNKKRYYIKANRRCIGGVDQFGEKPFVEHLIDISIETTFYIFSDGYQDQFGENGKKYMSKRYKELLDYIHMEPLEKQHNQLVQEHLAWRNNVAEQTDDILVIGCRV